MKYSTHQKQAMAPLSLVMMASLAVATSGALADEWNNQTSVLLGSKQLESEQWHHGDDQDSLLVMSDFQRDGFPVAIAVDLLIAGNDQDDIEEATAEIQVGPRWNIDTGTGLTPYLSGGLTLAAVSIDDEERFDDKQEESGHGWWAAAGMRYAVSDQMYLVADVRHSDANVTLEDEDIQAGGTQLGLGLGFSW